MILNVKFWKVPSIGPKKAQFKLSTFLIDFHDIEKSFDQRRMRVCHRCFEREHQSIIDDVEEEGGGCKLTSLEDAMYVLMSKWVVQALFPGYSNLQVMLKFHIPQL